jgi:hypothetical protein
MYTACTHQAKVTADMKSVPNRVILDKWVIANPLGYIYADLEIDDVSSALIGLWMAGEKHVLFEVTCVKYEAEHVMFPEKKNWLWRKMTKLNVKHYFSL